jgi:hypothetical protein
VSLGGGLVVAIAAEFLDVRAVREIRQHHVLADRRQAAHHVAKLFANPRSIHQKEDDRVRPVAFRGDKRTCPSVLPPSQSRPAARSFANLSLDAAPVLFGSLPFRFSYSESPGVHTIRVLESQKHLVSGVERAHCRGTRSVPLSLHLRIGAGNRQAADVIFDSDVSTFAEFLLPSRLDGVR